MGRGGEYKCHLHLRVDCKNSAGCTLRRIGPIHAHYDGMTNTSTVAAFALVILAGCAQNQVFDPDELMGGKSDNIGGSDLRCSVVAVNGENNFLEEGLGSIYDYDEEGFPEADGDSISVDYRTSSLSKHPSGRILGIGQFSFGLHSDQDAINELDEQPEFNDETGFLTIEAQQADSNRIFKVRIFSEFMVGLVSYRFADVDACKEEAIDDCAATTVGSERLDCVDEAFADCERTFMLAKIDCRGIDTPFDI